MSNPMIVGGLPTDLDVKLLLAAFPNWKAGETIKYEEIESILNLHRRASRFRTVVSAWRKQLLRTKNIDTIAVKTIGIQYLEERERVHTSAKDYRRSVRGIGRSVRRISLVRTETLVEDDRKVADHARRLMEATYSTAREATKEIAVSLRPQPQLPRGK